MYNLSQNEVRVLNEYYDLNTKNLVLGPLILEIHGILEFLFKDYCEIKYRPVSGIDEAINKVLSEDAVNIKNIDSRGRPVFKPHYKNFKDNILFINGLRNKVTHDRYIPTEIETDLSKQYIKNCIAWYFKNGIQKSIGDISSTDTIALKALNEIFPPTLKKEIIIEREIYYVILLIDSSMSMLWPYLNSQENGTNINSTDYKQAVKQVQDAMEVAHEKALNALRGSAACLKRSMKVYQYTFNHLKTVLNNHPEELAPVGEDNVKKITTNNYQPEGMTALYDTIEESLRVIYTNYLKPARDKSKRIDKLSIGVITDGEDTIIDGVTEESNMQLYKSKKTEKIKKIKELLRVLQGSDNPSEIYLEGSVLIGLTGNDFSEKKLTEIQKELGFRDSISINQADDKSIRKAFNTFSTNAINI